ncbi:hypothetical protein EV102420_09_02010 [Pseudescherichia vulneris NBRC 102420]|uniref:DUF2913 family protein n=1 Tax=Pseudescherichia vulneris NBRC 102420 TaxID=1115515 RepID=A0A090V4H7_PSEVU|nr:DUF2913 family protein [Pseudescherichia vulneris]GAL58169.1 hypothetical protein EV102420_09_02010 [Pseudescherichia vulneris NBRC 102420]STQ59877.1 Uncharacterised protein [Pseudescherichia vulneris]
MDIQRIKRVHHFYYCLLIAVKMYRRERRGLNKIEENTFIYCWLQKAIKNAVFEHALQNEIEWLITQLRGHGIRLDINSMVENIFVKLDHLLSELE